jgi:hypothetical protein
MRRAALAATLAAATVATATGAPGGTAAEPTDLRDYVNSGAYLADVTEATVPARTWLVTRTDAIAAERAACTAAGLPVGTTTAARRAAGTTTAPSPTAATGTATFSLGPLARRAGGARVAATSPATVVGAGAVRLATTRGRAAADAGTVWLAGGIVLRRGHRTLSLRELRVTVARGRTVRVVALVGGRRMTALTGTATARAARVDASGSFAVDRTGLRLTAAARARIRRVLRTAPPASARLATVTARAVVAQPTATTTPTDPRPADPAPDAAPTAPAPAPPTAASCAALPTRLAIVLDIDETAMSNYIDTWGDPTAGDAGQAGPAALGQSTAMAPILDLYREARRRGLAVFFITARPGIIAPQTRTNLRRVGYDAWDGLTFKNDLAAAKDAYKSAERAKVEAAGYRIVLNVGDQQTDLDGGHAERAFKLPNPFY